MTDQRASPGEQPALSPLDLVAFDDARLPMAIASPEGFPLRVNHAWTQYFGHTMDDLRGVSPVDVTSMEQPMLEAFLAILHSGGTVQEPLTVHAKDGRRVAVRVSAIALRDAAGDPMYIVVTFVPLHGQRAARVRDPESADDGSHQRRATDLELDAGELAAFDAAPLPMLLAEFDGTVLRVNAARTRLLGFTTADVAGKSVYEVTGVDHETIARVRASLLAGNSMHGFVRDNLTKDGRTVRVRGSITVFGSGTKRYALATAVPVE